MKSKIFYTTVLIIICTLISFLLYKNSTVRNSINTAEIKIEKTEVARLSLDGSSVKILTSTNEYSTTRDFIFLNNETGETITTVSIASLGLSTPYYRVAKGVNHDWLVVTKVETWGTGVRRDTNEWYILDQGKKMKLVLSYLGTSLEVPNGEGKNEYIRTEVQDVGNDDKSIIIRYINKLCSAGENNGDKDCFESVNTKKYLWDNDKEEFMNQ